MWNGQQQPIFGQPAVQPGVANPAGMPGTAPGGVDPSLPQFDPNTMQLMVQLQMLQQQVQQLVVQNQMLSQLAMASVQTATPAQGQAATAAGTATPQGARVSTDASAQGADQNGPSSGFDPYDQFQGSSQTDPWMTRNGDPWGGYFNNRRGWSSGATGSTQQQPPTTAQTPQPQPQQQPPTFSTSASGDGTPGGADTGPFVGKGAKDASSSITGVAARSLLEETRKNVATRLAEQQTAAGGWRNVASVLNHRDGKK